MTAIGVTGHQALPRRAREYLTHAIPDFLRTRALPITGVCSLADGADQLFAAAVLAGGGELHVVIPSSRYEETFQSQAALAEYHRLLNQATLIETLQHDHPTEQAFLHAGQKVVDRSDELVAIWDGKAARGLGGTADIADYAVRAGTPLTVIWPQGVER